MTSESKPTPILGTDVSQNPYDVPDPPAALSSKLSPEAADVTSRVSRARVTVVGVSVWQMACLVAVPLSRFVVASYARWYGDIEAAYSRFERLSTYLGLLVITLSATLVTIVIVDKLSASKSTLRQKLLTVACWELVTMIVLASSYESGFPYMINQVAWRVFGPPSDLYSFLNLVLPQIIAWVLCTIPIECIAIWCYLRSRSHT